MRFGVPAWLLLFALLITLGGYKLGAHDEDIPEPVDFPVDLKITPQLIKPRQNEQLEFSVVDPFSGQLAQHFQVVHEKLFHLFVVSQDLTFFRYGQPALGSDGRFRHEIAFPRAGQYRIVSDFYPQDATPQLSADTVIVPGQQGQSPAALLRDYSTKQAENMRISLETGPPQPNPGVKTILFFHIEPADGLEKYLDGWGHLFAASDDLIDTMHDYPFVAGGGPQVQFNLYFPRAHTYRVWVQFQRKGIINTASFDIPVQELK